MSEGNKVETQDGILVVMVDQDDCGGIWKSVEEQVGAGSVNVVLDFGEVSYLNSMNIAGIISLRNKVEGAGGKLLLANMKDQIVSIFRILKLERMFDLSLSRDAAVSSLST